jgi:putative membrane-bound dehydrogenase-like protein
MGLPSRAVALVLLLIAWRPEAPCRAEPFPEPVNSETDRAAAPRSADEAAATMDAPAGLQVGVFAAEPDVQNPIAMAWDARGRLWIAENHTYAERPLRMDARLRDRVLILADRDADGRADERTVFLDDLQQVTSVEVGLGGVWVLCPPRLLFVPDRNGDDVPDGPPRVILDGFDVATENHHNFANGLRFGPDGWLYGRCGASCPGLVGPPGTAADRRVRLEGGIWRYAPWSGRFEALCHGTTNPWGHDWNAWGDGFFINTVNGHLWQIIPGAHYDRPHTIDPNPHVYELLGMHADHWHFDTGAGWQKSRDGSASDLGGGHAHSGHDDLPRRRLARGVSRPICSPGTFMAGAPTRNCSNARGAATWAATPPTSSSRTTPSFAASTSQPAPTAACWPSTGATPANATRRPACTARAAASFGSAMPPAPGGPPTIWRRSPAPR